MKTFQNTSFHNHKWAREMAQWLRACTAFTDDPCLVPSTHIGWHTDAYNFNSRESDTLFWTLQAPAQTVTDFHTEVHAHTYYKNKK